MAIVGIDLGTTNSMVTVWKDGKCEVIPNMFGECLTPSVVSVDGENILVGKSARERLVTNPKLSKANFKSTMGTDKKVMLGNQSFSSEELSSFVIRQLIEDARAYLKEEIEEVIISVPAYFNDQQRSATKTAGSLANIKVERLINEPSAAAMAHSLGKIESKFLIVDFGGGTLDVSIVDAFENIVEIVAIAGDNQLGGKDFDEVLYDYFIKISELDESALTLQEKASILREAEACKVCLSKKETCDMNVKVNDVLITQKIDHQIFAQEAHSIFQRFKTPIDRVLRDAKTSVNEIDEILLVGGSCNMPVVQTFIEMHTGRKPLMSYDPDRIVGIGCGVVAGIKSRSEDVRDLLLTDICPFSMGINIINRDWEYDQSDIFSPIIDRNTMLPCSRVNNYHPVNPESKKMEIEIYQGEQRLCKDNVLIGKITHELKGTTNERAQGASVRFSYDINGILEVDIVNVAASGESHDVIINKHTSMKDDEIKWRMEQLSQLKIHPRDTQKNQYLIDKAERLFAELVGQVREELSNRLTNFKQALDSQDTRVIEKYYQSFEGYLNQLDEEAMYVQTSEVN